MTDKLHPPEEWSDDDPEGFWEASGCCPACMVPNQCIDEGECVLSRPEHEDLP